MIPSDNCAHFIDISACVYGEDRLNRLRQSQRMLFYPHPTICCRSFQRLFLAAEVEVEVEVEAVAEPQELAVECRHK